MINYKAARRYSTALYDLAEQLNLVDSIKQDFVDIRKTVTESREFRLFIESPIINPERKRLIIKEIFAGKISDISMNFIVLLAEKNRVNILKDITDSLLRLINEKRGIIEASITTAVELTDYDRKSITEKLANYSGKDIHPHYAIDKSIKGGFIAQINDKIIDASILRQLELLREKFKSGSFNN